MKHYSTNKRYCPHLLETKLHSVALYRQTKDIEYVCRKYHISKASLMRWNKHYNGNKDSLAAKSHKPHSPHPNAHTEQELKWIRDYHRRNPNISICELIRPALRGSFVRDSATLRPSLLHPAVISAFLFFLSFIFFLLFWSHIIDKYTFHKIIFSAYDAGRLLKIIEQAARMPGRNSRFLCIFYELQSVVDVDDF